MTNSTQLSPAKVPDSSTGRFGRFGEDCAAQWYRQAGYEILNQNWRCRRGEIDLIVSRESEAVFVEVKARSNSRFGSGVDAVDWRKQERIRTLASEWLKEAERYFEDLRFDVVDVDQRGHLEIYQDCF